jgi:hypothetical protein
LIGILYQAVYRFFNQMITPANKGEVDQPLPLNVQREHLEKQLAELKEKEAAYKRFLEHFEQDRRR